MLAALLNWPQAIFASHLSVQIGRATVTREVDSGLETLELTLPAVVTTDLRLNTPRYAALPAIRRRGASRSSNWRRPIWASTCGPRLEVLKTAEPPPAPGGVGVASVGELVERLRGAAAPAMRTLLVADHDGERLGDATARALTAAVQLGAPVDVLVAGKGGRGDCGRGGVARRRRPRPRRRCRGAGASAGRAAGGAGRGAGAGLARRSWRPRSAAGRNVLPRVAALLDVMQVSDVTAVLAADTFERPIYAGNVIETVRRIRDAARADHTRRRLRAAATAEAAPIEGRRRAAAAGGRRTLHFRRRGREPAGRRSVSARVVVAGRPRLRFGRGVRAPARAAWPTGLGAAIGASRAAVDAGYAANDMQVGQTGKIVAPELYIACGISGAIQHLAGMRGAKVIVAINNDPDAPIFAVADYGPGRRSVRDAAGAGKGLALSVSWKGAKRVSRSGNATVRQDSRWPAPPGPR